VPLIKILSPLEVLKKGLNALKKAILNHTTALRAHLAEGKSISSEDKCWLDKGNHTDEQWLIDKPEEASDFERGLGALDEKGHDIVLKHLPKEPQKRQKSA